MRRLSIRRSQLAGGNGPGSLIVSPEGESAIVSALDYWFLDSDGNKINSRSEFEIIEPRLKRFLGVDKFYMAPDYRVPNFDVPNVDLKIPLLRFPRMHYCSRCNVLRELNYSIESSKLECRECGKFSFFKQVPFIVICKNGHVSDFPWREWAHKTENPACKGGMKLITVGGSTLDSWSVKCACGANRSLRGITSSNSSKKNTSVLSERLNSNGKEYKCIGHKAWCGDEFEPCNESPVAILRNSVNVYMPSKVSTISLPSRGDDKVDEIMELINQIHHVKAAVSSVIEFDVKVNLLEAMLGSQIITSRKSFEDAIRFLDGENESKEVDLKDSSPDALRISEFEYLSDECESNELKVFIEWDSNSDDAESTAGGFLPYIERVNRVPKLRETSALAGFKRLSRMDDDGEYSFFGEIKDLYHSIDNNSETWLPANSVFGEGIFIQFNLDKIREWERTPKVQDYFRNYKKRVESSPCFMPKIKRLPRNVMMHTLVHLMIEEISNTSGYNTASIRERLYLDEGQASILIYTSAGDIEGTFGGVVRLGRKDNFFKLLDKAITNSRWCSSDPVCSEIGSEEGQGLGNTNGAACYNCCHLPETSCEVGNMYLDRMLISDSNVGFFKELL